MDIKVLASGSSGNCYLISDGTTSLLLDAGIPIARIREGCGYRLSEIAGCLVTHCHGDHSKAIKGLLESTVPVYMPAGEIEALKLPKHHRLHPLQKRSGTDNGYLDITVQTMRILPFRAQHDTPEPVGYLVVSVSAGEKLLYFTDTFYLSSRFSGITHIIGECNYDRETMWERYNSGQTPTARVKRLFTTHMSLDTFVDLLRSIDHPEMLQQIYICHMSDDHGNEAKIRDTVQKATGAEVYIC